MSQNNFNHSINCQNTTNSYNTTTTSNVWNNCTVNEDLSPLLTWLSPLDPGLRHCDIQERRVKDVGEWLTGTENFRRWCESGEGDEAVLFCYGNPGVGKTFISSLVVDRLCDRTRGQNTAVTCFYFDFAARKEQTVTSMLGSLLRQVISGMERVPEEISRAFQEQKKAVSGRKPQLCDIVKMLRLITSSQRIFMVIDALDECTAVQRFRLFDSLKEILEKSPGARIFVTGRPHIQAEIETRLAGRVTSISVGPARDDIIRFLRVKLSEDETPEAMDENLEADILEKIPGSVSEMFLLVSLNIEVILQESTAYRRREKLRKVTDGLGLEGVYGATIERIKAQGGDKSTLGLGALMWVSHAERLLEPRELCHALAIELGSTDFNAGNIPSITTLVSCCQGLITVDKEASTVRLIHFTLKEYLSTHPDIFSRPHAVMAEICLTYLNSQHVKALSADHSADPYSLADDKPFLRYCSVFWGVHARRELTHCGRSLALELLMEYDGHISVAFLLEEFMEEFDLVDNFEDFDRNVIFNGLHCASSLGIVEIVAALIETRDYDLNGKDFRGFTPLAWAAERGREEVVKLLLGREEVKPDEPDTIGETPLFHAAWRGHERVMKELLGREDVNPDKPNDYGRTPLFVATASGHQEGVRMLLAQEEVNPDKLDIYGKTPLSLAAGSGHKEVVRMLLAREEVNPDKLDIYGKTPLSLAIGWGHKEVVRMLLAREEVNPDRLDTYGETPRSLAARKGHEEVVKMLLAREEVKPNNPNFLGQTPLTRAIPREEM